MSNEPIRVLRATRGFTIIKNTALEDPRLSMKAKGIISYLIGKPPGWQGRVKDLANHSKDGYDSLLAGLKELAKYGHAKKVVVRTSGRFSQQYWKVTDDPRLLASPSREKPSTENPVHSNKHNNSEADPCGVRRRAEFEGMAGPEDSRPPEFCRAVKEFSKFSRKQGWDRAPNGKPVNGSKTDGGWHLDTLKRWEKEYSMLASVQGRAKADAALRFFLRNWHDPFAPRIRRLNQFCDRFDQVLAFQRRTIAQRERNGECEDDYQQPVSKKKQVKSDPDDDVEMSDAEFEKLVESVRDCK